MATSGDSITVACTQESPVFSEVAAETGGPAISFINIRETAGWSKDAARTAPKMAALLAAAAEPATDIPFVSFNSEGIILIYGVDEKAIEAADLLKDHLDVTVMISRPRDIAPRRTKRVPRGAGDDPLRQGFSRTIRDRG